MLDFIQAVDLAIATVPGLRHDFNIMAERRKNTMRDMEGVGRWALSIPEPIEPLLKAYHPELYQDDIKAQQEAWLKFIQHPDSLYFRTQDNL